MLAIVSAALGVVEVIGQRRTLTALDNLCSQAECGNLFRLTNWIVGAQLVVCAAVIIYVSSCAFLLKCPVAGYRLAVALLLALVFCFFQLIGAMGQFASPTSVVGSDGEPLDMESWQVVLGLGWCLTVVCCLMVLLVCADHAQHVATNNLLIPKYMSYTSMSQWDDRRTRKDKLKCKRDSQLVRLWGEARCGWELYPIMEADSEDEEDESEPNLVRCELST